MSHPYQGLPGYQFHRTAVAEQHPAFFDPLTETKFKLGKDDAIATMGSCFAQHLSKWLVENGRKFFVTEPSHDDAGGLYSANFGNIYTVAQALQVYRYAYGHQQPSGDAWVNAAGKFVDPLRPSVTGAGFDTVSALLQARQAHYAAVRAMFQAASVLVFTLGLTEAWLRKTDNAVLPSAPGVAAGSYIAADYDFVNFTHADVCESLSEFLRCVTGTNPSIKVILTVSPVPSAATFVKRHVAVSSMASKAILRAAVDAVVPNWGNVEYFPSFEIFYTPGIGANYFETDCRHVSRAGVSHVMRVFDRHFLGELRPMASNATYPLTANAAALLKAHYDTWCDEDQIQNV